MLWVFARAGDKLVNHDGSSRSDILRFSPVSFAGSAGGQDHCFEKPQKLCEFLVRKHTYEGELVLDLCGCTGSMTLAAIEAKRQWLYVESNAANYRLGSNRIAQQLSKRRMAVL
jgi:DNA modification methylase